MVIDPCPHAAQAQGDIGHVAQFGDGGGDPVLGRLAVNLAAIDRRTAAPMCGLFHQEHLGPSLCRREGGLQARHAAADHGHVAEEIEMLVPVGIAGVGRLAQARRLADEGFVDMLPERARVDEHLVVEARGQEAREMGVDRADVIIKAGPVVLAGAAQTVEKLGRGHALVGFHARALAQMDERVGLFGPACHDAARAVVFERPPDQHLIIGQKGRGERVTGMALEALAVEGEVKGAALVEEAATLGQTRAHVLNPRARCGRRDVCIFGTVTAHAKSLHRQPGRLAVIASRICWGGSWVWAG